MLDKININEFAMAVVTKLKIKFISDFLFLREQRFYEVVYETILEVYEEKFRQK
jgi:hypothetical protein